MNFNRITEHLYVGGRLNPYDWETLAGQGITINVSLQAEAQDQFLGAVPEVSLWLPTPAAGLDLPWYRMYHCAAYPIPIRGSCDDRAKVA